MQEENNSIYKINMTMMRIAWYSYPIYLYVKTTMTYVSSLWWIIYWTINSGNYYYKVRVCIAIIKKPTLFITEGYNYLSIHDTVFHDEGHINLQQLNKYDNSTGYHYFFSLLKIIVFSQTRTHSTERGIHSVTCSISHSYLFNPEF